MFGGWEGRRPLLCLWCLALSTQLSVERMAMVRSGEAAERSHSPPTSPNAEQVLNVVLEVGEEHVASQRSTEMQSSATAQENAA